MRKSWPFAIVVIVVGGLAGVAIAGRPEPSDPFVLEPSITSVATSTTSPAASTTTSEPSTTTTLATATTTAASTTTVPATTTTAAPTTTTTVAPTTVVPTTTILGPLPHDQVRLVLANGDGRFRLASVTADRIRPLGYQMVLGDAVNLVDATTIYYRPGFDDEAAFAAEDIGVPDAIILPFPTNTSQPITDSDAGGDVIVVLGPDAPR
ncbi:MAG TPA: LytR C-terminal domain-containing protein [Ilumatobacteraceae bacterium]|jgi:hypothetical protein|nr:LytR C-terminal domain-containing protein [Ilumatobacteraceae bacterium]